MLFRSDYKPLFSLISEQDKETVGAKTANEYKNTWVEALDTLGTICADQIDPNARKVEKEQYQFVDGKEKVSPALTQNMTTLEEYGVGSFGVSTEFGGLGAPFIFQMAACELLNRACPSTMLNASWYAAIADVIERFGSDALKEEYIPRIAAGEFSGNMALTEPDAGSDLSALKTYGEKQQDGS